MSQESTIEYNMDNYLEAIKACNLITYSLEEFKGIPSTIYVRDFLQNESLSLIRKKSHEELSAGWSKLANL